MKTSTLAMSVAFASLSMSQTLIAAETPSNGPARSQHNMQQLQQKMQTMNDTYEKRMSDLEAHV